MNHSFSSQHPIIRQEYAVYTPPMDEMIKKLGDFIDQRFSGGYIYGPSRFGKSRTIKWFVRTVLEERFGKRLPMVVWVRRDTQIQERQFWNLLLLASHFHFVDPEKPKSKSQASYLFMQRLITLARMTHQNYIVILIDEAQDVTINEWKWLLGLQNQLDDEGYRLSIFSIGSHQLGWEPDFVARVGNPHIAARFFPVSMRFHGLRSVDELVFVLRGYDEDSDWPKGSSTSFLEYFAPDEFRKNNRLSNHAEDLWKAFTDLVPPTIKMNKRGEGIELPMLHVALVAEQLLKLLTSGKKWDDVMNYDSFLRLIAGTSFEEHLRRIDLI